MTPFFISIPHSGEKFPNETTWLEGLDEPVLMRDVDRFVDKLYQPVIDELDIPSVVTEWHRYVVDLNRLPEDVDCDSVEGAPLPSGSHPTGLHWRVTTQGETLIPSPISMELHKQLVRNYFEPFHQKVREAYKQIQSKGAEKVYQLDAHSMPSMGTKAHADPGQSRPEIVVSDVHGVSCEKSFLDLVVESYEQAGFEVAVNFPYKGGRVTQTYGKPELGQHAIQVELNRRLYMNEETKRPLGSEFAEVQAKIQKAVTSIYKSLSE